MSCLNASPKMPIGIVPSTMYQPSRASAAALAARWEPGSSTASARGLGPGSLSPAARLGPGSSADAARLGPGSPPDAERLGLPAAAVARGPEKSARQAEGPDHSEPSQARAIRQRSSRK